MIKTINKGKYVSLSEHFTSHEFDCSGKGCCSATKVSTELVDVLEKIRTHFGKSLTVNSGYRCIVHNKAIGGASASKHTTGTAADIKISGVDPVKIALYADSIMMNGGVELGSYSTNTNGYVHIDVRPNKWRSIRPASASTRYTSYSTMTPTIKYGTEGDCVKVVSRKLRQLGYLSTDKNKCDATMENAIKAFQKAKGLTQDGVFGAKSWQKLAESL